MAGNRLWATWLASTEKATAAPEHTVIDNDNLHQVMDEVQTRKLKGSLLFSIDGVTKKFQVSSPDVTCDLSFSASATALLSDAYAPQDLPESELAKLDGPATITGDTLQVAVHNGTTWNIKEITVGLTILRGPRPTPRRGGAARLVPAAQTTTMLSEKHPDSTVLYHLKGSAAPSSTTVFHENLGVAPGQDQEWHWAIVQAKGVPSSKPETRARPGSIDQGQIHLTRATSSVFPLSGCGRLRPEFPGFASLLRPAPESWICPRRGRESVHLPGIGHAIRDLVSLNQGTGATQFQRDRPFHVQRVISSQDASLPD